MKQQVAEDIFPKIGIFILNRNGKEWLPPLYDSIRANGYPNGRVYLVDNASADDSVEMTLERFPEVTVIRMPQNLGYTVAYNLAMPHGFADGCDWVIWANNDIRLEPGCLGELARIARANPAAGVLGPAFLAWENDEANYYILGNHPYAIQAMKSRSPAPIDVEWVEGSFLMVSRCCLEAVGPLDPFFFLYWEEADFCRRARFHGWRVLLVPSALVRHYGGGSSTGEQQIMPTANQLQSRNYYIYKLTNPFQSFSGNLFDFIHLFLTLIRCPFPALIPWAKTHARIFAGVLRDIHTIYKKWDRDRVGGHPPMIKGDILFPKVEVIQGKGIRISN